MTRYLRLLRKAWETVRQTEFLIKELATEALGKYQAFDLDVGNMWECPDWDVGVCVYNKWNDRGHDSCLFCEEPEERK